MGASGGESLLKRSPLCIHWYCIVSSPRLSHAYFAFCSYYCAKYANLSWEILQNERIQAFESSFVMSVHSCIVRSHQCCLFHVARRPSVSYFNSQSDPETQYDDQILVPLPCLLGEVSIKTIHFRTERNIFCQNIFHHFI